MADDDDRWLARLRGKAEGADSPPERRMVESLRAAISRRNQATEVRHDEPRETEQLLFRLRREGLLGHDARPRWKRFAPVAATAVIVGGIALTALLRLQPPGSDEPPVMRGGPASQVFDVGDPAAAAEALQDRLKRAGIASERYEVGGVIGVTATVPAEDRNRVREALVPLSTGLGVLAPQSIVLPADGRLKVEFRSPRR